MAEYQNPDIMSPGKAREPGQPEAAAATAAAAALDHLLWMVVMRLHSLGCSVGSRVPVPCLSVVCWNVFA